MHPENLHNTGAIGRLRVGPDARLHLVRPIGFQSTERRLRRSGLDDREHLELRVRADWAARAAALGPARCRLATTEGERSLYDRAFETGDILVFGTEGAGLPEAPHAAHPDRRFAFPMPGRHARGLDLAQAAAAAACELRRRLRRPGGACRASRTLPAAGGAVTARRS